MELSLSLSLSLSLHKKSCVQISLIKYLRKLFFHGTFNATALKFSQTAWKEATIVVANTAESKRVARTKIPCVCLSRQFPVKSSTNTVSIFEQIWNLSCQRHYLHISGRRKYPLYTDLPSKKLAHYAGTHADWLMENSVSSCNIIGNQSASCNSSSSNTLRRVEKVTNG